MAARDYIRGDMDARRVAQKSLALWFEENDSSITRKLQALDVEDPAVQALVVTAYRVGVGVGATFAGVGKPRTA